MKKRIITLIAFVMIALFALTFTACGDGDKAADATDASQAVTEKPTEAPTEGFDAEAAAAEAQKQLIGSWTFYNRIYKEAYESLVFNADGTGSYQGGTRENDKYEKDYTFTYTVTTEPPEKHFNAVNVLTIKYNEVDETEVRHFGFYDDGMLFLNYVDYDHSLITFDEYIRVEDVPKE